MADTIRTLTALQTLLLDNSSNIITPQNVRDFLVSADPENAVGTGPYASLPANRKAGFIYLPNDAPYILRDTGTVWQAFGPFQPLTPPVTTGFAWVNQGGATLTTTNGLHSLLAPNSGSDTFRIRVKTAPVTPYTVTALISMIFLPAPQTAVAGLVIRESGTGKFTDFAVGFSGVPRVFAQFWNNESSFNSTNQQLAAASGFFLTPRHWLRIADNGTNIICSYSPDGFNWMVIDTRSRTAFMAAPDQIGFCALGNGTDTILSILSWKEA